MGDWTLILLRPSLPQTFFRVPFRILRLYQSVFFGDLLCAVWNSRVFQKTWLLVGVYHQMGGVVKAKITSAVPINPASHPESKES